MTFVGTRHPVHQPTILSLSLGPVHPALPQLSPRPTAAPSSQMTPSSFSLSLGFAQVERNQFLVSPADFPPQRDAILLGRPLPCRITLPWKLNPDHLGAKIPSNDAAIGPAMVVSASITVSPSSGLSFVVLAECAYIFACVPRVKSIGSRLVSVGQGVQVAAATCLDDLTRERHIQHAFSLPHPIKQARQVNTGGDFHLVQHVDRVLGAHVARSTRCKRAPAQPAK